jgi:hypothetical protein
MFYTIIFANLQLRSDNIIIQDVNLKKSICLIVNLSFVPRFFLIDEARNSNHVEYRYNFGILKQ